MQIPGITKVVVNMGIGDAASDSKLINGAIEDFTLLTGQKPQIRIAKKAIAYRRKPRTFWKPLMEFLHEGRE